MAMNHLCCPWAPGEYVAESSPLCRLWRHAAHCWQEQKLPWLVAKISLQRPARASSSYMPRCVYNLQYLDQQLIFPMLSCVPLVSVIPGHGCAIAWWGLQRLLLIQRQARDCDIHFGTGAAASSEGGDRARPCTAAGAGATGPAAAAQPSGQLPCTRHSR